MKSYLLVKTTKGGCISTQPVPEALSLIFCVRRLYFDASVKLNLLATCCVNDCFLIKCSSLCCLVTRGWCCSQGVKVPNSYNMVTMLCVATSFIRVIPLNMHILTPECG